MQTKSYTEAKILSLLSHSSLPWLFAVCDTKHIALAMSFHTFGCDNESVTIYKAFASVIICNDNTKLEAGNIELYCFS